MLEFFLYMFFVGPLWYLIDTRDYLLEGAIRLQTRERWELEKQIKTQFKLLTYFETCSMYDITRSQIYEETCDKVFAEIIRLRSRRDGSRKVKMLP